MVQTPSLTPKQRVLMFVGGNFSKGSLGPLYDQVLGAIDANPKAHMQAFRALFLDKPASRLALTDYHLDTFLLRMAKKLPQDAKAASQTLLTRMAALARQQSSEMAEADSEGSAVELGRQQRELAARRDLLARIVHD